MADMFKIVVFCKFCFWLSLLLIMKGWDIELDPGPYKPKFPCLICEKAAKWSQKCLQCTSCLGWYHTSCLDMSDSLYEIHLQNQSLEWTCYHSCGMPQFWNLDSTLFKDSISNVDLSPSTSKVSDNPDSVSGPNVSFSECKSPPTPKCPHPSATSTPVTPVATPSPAKVNTSSSVSSIEISSGCSYSIGPAKKRNEITIVVANCDGVTGKKASIENMLTSLQPDVFLAVESKLDQSVFDAEFLPQTYRDSPPVRKDRKRGGGGVFIAVREGILAEHLSEFDSNCEIAWLKIHLQSKNSLIIGVFYRPPDSDITSLYELNDSISKVVAKHPRAKIFLGGDFNLPGINWESFSHTPGTPKRAESEFLLQTAADFFLDQVNFHPTRKENILELLFTSCPETVLHCDTGPRLSDHDHILIARVNLRVVQNKKKPRTIHLYKKADWDKAKEMIKSSEEEFFKNNPEDKSVNENWNHLKTCLLSVIDKCVPSKKISGRFKPPWITQKIKRLIRRKQRAYNKAKCSKKEEDWATFRRIRKKTQKKLKDSHFDYVNEAISEDGNKGLWRYLKSMRKDTCGVNTLIKDGFSASDPADKAKFLNEQFSSVFTHENTADIPDLGPSPHPQMSQIKIENAGVRKLLKDLNPNKACGSDKIPAVLLKKCAEEISPILTFIFQQTLDKGSVPDDWKIALVTPIFKKGKRSAPENYRPVSLTSICCKINEHIIVSQTISHLEQHNILVDYQHGFRRRRSCESQLLVTAHDLASVLNKHSQVDVAVLDFAKAFDKVPHQRLIEKLRFYNIHPNVISWTTSFLSNRTQSVVVDGFTSDEAAVISGVPQGTVMGPMLFLIFINDIACNISSTVRLFADDCLLYKEIVSKADTTTLQQDLTELVEWSKTWGMAFNISKCNVLSVTNATKHKIEANYEMDGKPLNNINSTLYLGVTISRKLQWKEHIDVTCSAATRMLGFLRRNLSRCPQNIKEKAYKSAIRPKLEYCSSIWDPHTQKDIDKIEMVQKRAARFVKNIPHRRTGQQTSATAIVQSSRARLGDSPTSNIGG